MQLLFLKQKLIGFFNRRLFRGTPKSIAGCRIEKKKKKKKAKKRKTHMTPQTRTTQSSFTASGFYSQGRLTKEVELQA